MNKATLLGRVGRDPEVRTFDNGGKKVFFTLATSTRWKNKDGEKQERTEWHNIVAMGPVTDVISRFVKKGDQLLVTGEIRYRKYESDGVQKSITEIHLEDIELIGGTGSKPAAEPETEAVHAEEVPTDDIPF